MTTKSQKIRRKSKNNTSTKSNSSLLSSLNSNKKRTSIKIKNSLANDIASNRFLTNIFDSVSDLIFVLDNNGSIIQTNKRVFITTKISDDELLDVHIDDLFQENKVKSFFTTAIKKIKNKPAADFHSSFYLSKKLTSCLCSISGFYNENGQQLGYLLFVKDLTSLKKIEKSLKHTEYKYKKLFEESGDAIIIINKKGIIQEINDSGKILIGLSDENLHFIKFSKFIYDDFEINKFESTISSPQNIKEIILKLKNKKNKNIYNCLVSVSPIANSKNILIFIKDISDQIEMDNLVIRTIVETQENERKRFARDIHDSLGQELSAVKFYLSSISQNIAFDGKNKNLLIKTDDALTKILASIREICFNLMPKTLEKFGLVMAVKELTNTININSSVICKVRATTNFPRLSPEKEVGVFRIIQEFINNSIKHSKGDIIKINFSTLASDIVIKMSDNGVGFELQSKDNFSGMGLKNMATRARSYNGQLTITSNNNGTSYYLKIPIK